MDDNIKILLSTNGLHAVTRITESHDEITQIGKKPRMKINPDLSVTLPVIKRIAQNDGRCPFILEENSIEDDHCPCSAMLCYGKCICDLYIEY